MNRLTFRSLIAALGLIALLSLPSIASADGATWTLSGVTFGDWTNVVTVGGNVISSTVIGTGGAASGSFVYDALNNTYSSVTVSTTPWVTSSVPYTPTPDSVAISNASGLGLWDGSSTDLTDISFLFLVFNDPTNPFAGPDPLTNAGGKRSISLTPGDSMEFICLDAGCDIFDERSFTGGEVTGVAVVTPEPAAFSLLAIGLLASLIGSAVRKVVSA
jgi:hypothetical protein